MGRSHIVPVQQPDDTTCGPTALKHALAVLGKRKSVTSLIELCKTNRNGTTTKNLVKAILKLGFCVEVVEYATLRHLQGSLKYQPTKPRAVLVSYLYDLDEKEELNIDSGHWAVVSSYRTNKSRIVLLDSASGQKKSYAWDDFRERWIDFDLKKKHITNGEKSFRFVRKWQPQLLLIMAKKRDHLPKFKIATARIFDETTPLSA